LNYWGLFFMAALIGIPFTIAGLGVILEIKKSS